MTNLAAVADVAMKASNLATDVRQAHNRLLSEFQALQAEVAKIREATCNPAPSFTIEHFATDELVDELAKRLTESGVGDTPYCIRFKSGEWYVSSWGQPWGGQAENLPASIQRCVDNRRNFESARMPLVPSVPMDA